MATSGEPVVNDAKVGQTSKPTADKFFKDFFTDVDFNGASGASASSSSSGTGSVGSDSDWPHVVNRARLTNLLKKRPENSKIFNWIERYVAEAEKTHPEFIRALITIICQNAAEGDVHGGHIDTKIIKQRVPLLQRYINNKRHLELHALYAVQAFNHSLHNPPGLLRILFGVLYEEDVSSQESFYDWKVRVVPDTNPAKQEPKEEKPDQYDMTEDRENVNEADNVESENSKNKEGKPNAKDNKMQLKYAYREDQWSPVNPEGKKQYDRDFLLQFQKGCTDKPDLLPNIPDIVLDRAVVSPLSLNIPQGGNQKSSDFMPHFMKSPKVQGGKRARVSVDTKLLTLDEAWKPGFKHGPEETADEEAVKTQELFRNFTSILNKLTPQLFNTIKLTDKALQLPIDTEERLKGVVSLVFEKALSEPNFRTAYAHMCQKLSQLKVQSTTTPGTQVQFRPILVHNCQQEFEKEKQTEIDEAQRRKEIAQLPASQQEAQLELLQEKLFKAKRRTMGNIRFIGELYKLRILKENVMHNCIKKLLKAKDDESLECVCVLMNTIGKDLDHEKAKNLMDQYFSKIDKIIASQKNAPRIRFLMYDLVDLRKSNWVPRRQESKPTTIDALHKEWHVAEAKKAEESSTRTAYDPSKLKLTRMTADDNIQLGPGGRGFSTWGRGSIGASNMNQSPSD